MDPLRMMINRSVFHDLQWRPENGVKLHVVDKRKGGKGHVATYRYNVTQLLWRTNLINSIAQGDQYRVTSYVYLLEPSHNKCMLSLLWVQ